VEVPIRRPLRAEIGAANALDDAVGVRTLRIVETPKNYIIGQVQVMCQLCLSYRINNLECYTPLHSHECKIPRRLGQEAAGQ
jgi:hypothetical protein